MKYLISLVIVASCLSGCGFTLAKEKCAVTKCTTVMTTCGLRFQYWPYKGQHREEVLPRKEKKGVEKE